MVLLAFLLGFPANEIVLPILLMGYLHTGTLTECGGLEALRDILLHSGWTTETALCMMALCLLHFPCGTTCLTIRRETGGCPVDASGHGAADGGGDGGLYADPWSLRTAGINGRREPGEHRSPAPFASQVSMCLPRKPATAWASFVLPLAGETILR